MTAARDDTLYWDKDLWQYFQKVLEKKGFESYLYCYQNLQCQVYNLLLLNWYLLGVEMNLRHAHKTRFWYLLRVFLKMSDKHPVTFIGEYPLSPPPRVHSSGFTMQRTLHLRDRALIYPGHTNRHPFLLQEGEILKVLYTSQHF